VLPSAGADVRPQGGGDDSSLHAQVAIAEQVRAAAVRVGVPATVGSGRELPTAMRSTRPSGASSAGAVAPADPPAIQRMQAEPTPSSPTATATTSASSSAASPAAPERTTSATTPGPQPEPPDLDELARRLYPRFRTRLRHDLLADRERSGRLFDGR
jgi:hypothetical protein